MARRDQGRLPAREADVATAALLERLPDAAALVVDDTCQVLAWNPLAAATRYPASTGIRSLVADLLAGSPDFARLWNSQQLQIEHHSREVFQHPQMGPIELNFDILTVPDRDQQVVIFTADPDSDAYSNLQFLKLAVDGRDQPSGIWSPEHKAQDSRSTAGAVSGVDL